MANKPGPGGSYGMQQLQNLGGLGGATPSLSALGSGDPLDILTSVILQAARQAGGGAFAPVGLIDYAKGPSHGTNILNTVWKEAANGGDINTHPERFLVYMGGHGGKNDPMAAANKTAGDEVTTAAQAMNLPYTWSNKHVTQAMEKMRNAGFTVNSFDVGTHSFISLWNSMVARAAQAYTLSKGQKKVTPWDALELYGGELKAGTPTKPTHWTISSTSRSVNDLTDGEVWSVLQSQMQQLLGHDPSDKEIRSFTYKMGQLAARNPSITKTVQHYRTDPVTHQAYIANQSSHTSGGFTQADALEAAYNRAQNDPGYAEYQAASTYLNALASALGPIGGNSTL